MSEESNVVELLSLSRERVRLKDRESCRWLLRKYLNGRPQLIDRGHGRWAFYDETPQRLLLYVRSDGSLCCYSAVEVTTEQARDISSLFMAAECWDDKAFLDTVRTIIPSTPPHARN